MPCGTLGRMFTDQELIYLAYFCRVAARRAQAKADAEIGTRKDPHLAEVAAALELEKKSERLAASSQEAFRSARLPSTTSQPQRKTPAPLSYPPLRPVPDLSSQKPGPALSRRTRR